MSPPRIRLLLADDQQLFAESLSYVLGALAPDLELLGRAKDGVEAVRLAEETTPDVILMDVRMPELDGVDAARLILARLPGTRILMLSTFLDPEQARAALRHGARGYLLKDMRPADLVEAIRAVHRGATLFSGQVAEALVGAPGGGDAQAPWDAELSPREAQVAALVTRGRGNRQIAAELGLSEQTVRNYVSAVYFKLGVKDRFELMRLAGRG